MFNHERLCSDNPNKQESPFVQYNAINPTPWCKGKRFKIKSRSVQSFYGKRHSSETKIKMSLSRKTLYESGWEAVAGRCKKYDYVSPIAGAIKVDGTWELAVCKYFDKMKFKWERNKRRFHYIKPDGNNATYQPDFYVYDWQSYVEVKGYETELDRCKWSQFIESLKIFKIEDIKQIMEDCANG